ncbi:MAG: 2-succinylbenzoate--CoA ligase [Formosa sp. Hel3_A1_48]|nr:MAG: 2-succinylbenzoate--CoA ligase [Formosa sp. Hel3_A1_48]
MDTNKAHTNLNEAFQWNDKQHSIESVKLLALDLIKNGTTNEVHLGQFVLNWVDDSQTICLKTSGTTSKPKSIVLPKSTFVNSAIATGNFFSLNPGDSALCCLPFSYIAAKMMFVRAWVLGLKLEIVEPSSTPLKNISKHYDFSAMVPMQVHNSLPKLHQIKTLLVGGAAVSKGLSHHLMRHGSAIFETYGMTETVSHIAVKNISKGEDNFTVLPDISIAIDDRDCLVVQAPKLTPEILHTNDVVSLVSKKSFIWLGRFDNVINSGGLKIHPEEIETLLQNQIKTRFFISSIPDELLGQKIVLIIEGKPQKQHLDFTAIDTKKRPKKVFYLEAFSETGSGKIQRQKTLELLHLNHT